jgi:cytochrome c553
MAKVLRWAGHGLGTIVLLVLIAAAAIWLMASAKLHASLQARPEHLVQPTAAQLADAERQARTLGCFSCHGEGLRGDKFVDDPALGTIWAPNLTRVAARATDQQLAAAIRQGVSDEGEPLIIMPSEVFQHLGDQEVTALISYSRTLPRVGNETPPHDYGPLGRLGVVMGKFKTAPELVAKYAANEPRPAGAQLEAGRQLAMTKCSGCHGPSLEGQEVEPGVTSPDLTIAGAYDLPAFTKLLRTGVPASGRKLKMMSDIARSDLSHLNDSEIGQLHSYLAARAQADSR